MRVLNICGYGNTGCTALLDFVSDFEGVGFAHHELHEIGHLKCHYSFGGALLSKLQNRDFPPTKAELKKSMLGIDPEGGVPLSESAALHLKMRQRLRSQYPGSYDDVVEAALASLPEQYMDLEEDVVIDALADVVRVWISGLAENMPVTHFLDETVDNLQKVVIYKNDPPGSYPLLSSLIPAGISCAVLRDPRDTCFDFNRHYGIAISEDTVKAHCLHYRSQIQEARREMEKYSNRVQHSYKVVEFEALVRSQEVRDRVEGELLGKRKKIRDVFSPESSASNIDMYHQLSPPLLAIVEENCMELYESYRSFASSEGYLID